MPQDTHFSSEWLKGTDENGHQIKDWCTESEDDKFCAYCLLCKKPVDIRNRGKGQLISHANGKKHKEFAVRAFAKGQTKLVAVGINSNTGEKIMRVNQAGASTGPSGSLEWRLTADEEVAKAEIIWTLKVAESGYSYASCSSLNEEFRTMFPDSKIAKSFALGADKVSYGIAYGLGPFFHGEVVREVRDTDALYTLSFDEATNDCGSKQLDIHLRWWGTGGRVKNYYFCTYLLGHATAEILKDKILNALNSDELNLKHLIMVSSDGPNVNKKLLSILNDHLTSKSNGIGHTGLVLIGSCNLHIVHNSFEHGLHQIDNWEIPEFLDAVFKYFHKYAARKEDFEEIQDLLEIEHNEFKRYVNSRWLSLVPVVQRVLQQYEALKHYFLELLPKKKDANIDGYYAKKILQTLRDPMTPVRLHFLMSVGNLYSKFVTLMQSDRPLIHVLYDELTELIRGLMGRFVKASKVDKMSGRALSKIDLSEEENLKELQKTDIGEETRRMIKKKNDLSQGVVTIFYHDARKFLVSVVTYLLARVPLANTFLRNLRCLHPLKREQSSSQEEILAVAEGLKLALPASEHDTLKSEWRMYASDNIPKEWYIEEEYNTSQGHHITWTRIDDYWHSVLKQSTSLGAPKYPTLSKVVKAALTLSHGQAHVERGFSLNKTLVTSIRSRLKDKSINGLRTVQDRVKQEGGVTQVPITPTTLNAFQKAYSKYKADKREEKRIEDEKSQQEEKRKEEEKRSELKRKQERKETELYAKQKKLQEDIDSSKKLLEEANRRLKKECAKKKINATEISAAQALLESGKSKLDVSTKSLKKVSDEISSISKRRKETK